MADEARLTATYLSSILKAVIDGASQALDHGAISYTLVSFDGKDFVRDSTGADGKIDENRLLRNTGMTVTCRSGLDSDLFRAFNAGHISYLAACITEPGKDGKGENISYCAVDARDAERAGAIVKELNRAKSHGMEPEEFLRLSMKQKDVIVGISGLAPDTYREMEESGGLNFDHCVIKAEDGTVGIRFAEKDTDRARELVIRSAALCAGGSGGTAGRRTDEERKALGDGVARMMDSRKSYVVIDADNPDRYAVTGANGFTCYTHTGDGEIKTEETSRMSPHYQDRAYEFLNGFGRPKVIENGPDTRKEIEKIREEAMKEGPVPAAVKSEYYRKNLSGAVLAASERAWNARLADNARRFGDSIDRAARENDMELKTELLRDRAENGRAMEGIISANAVDMSDISRSPDENLEFEDYFITNVLGMRNLSGDELKQVKDRLEQNGSLDAIRELSRDSTEIQETVIARTVSAVEEMKDFDPDIGEVTLEELKHEVEITEERENPFTLTMEMKEEEREGA